METIRRSRAAVMLAALLAAVVAFTLVFDDPAEARKKKRKRYTTVFVDQIVFASTCCGVNNNADGDLEIFSIKPDGTGLKQLTFNDVHDVQPALSPNGRKIAYSSPGDQTENTKRDEEIYVMNADGSGTPLNLTDQGDTDTLNSDDTTPDWSPDGTKIAYTNGIAHLTEIYVTNADGSGSPTNWTNNAAARVADFRPTFSPDGQRIAFTSMGPSPLGETPVDFEIYDMSALSPSSSPSSSWRNLTDDADYDYRPKYSPDGNTIVYDSTPNCVSPSQGGDFDVKKMNADGSGTPLNLTDPDENDDKDNLHSDFSPTRNKIVYMKLPAGNTSGSCAFSPNSAPGELYTMNSDGTSPTTPLTNTNNQFINQSPDWGGYWIRVRR